MNLVVPKPRGCFLPSSSATVLVHLAVWAQLGVLTRIFIDKFFQLGCDGGWGPCVIGQKPILFFFYSYNPLRSHYFTTLPFRCGFFRRHLLQRPPCQHARQLYHWGVRCILHCGAGERKIAGTAAGRQSLAEQFRVGCR